MHLGQDNLFVPFLLSHFASSLWLLPICSFCVVTKMHRISPFFGKFHLDAPLILRILRNSEMFFLLADVDHITTPIKHSYMTYLKIQQIHS